MPSYSKDWNPFPKLTPKFQLRVMRLAALWCLVVLAAALAILTWVDSTQTYCPGWIIDTNNNTIWPFIWIWSIPIAAFGAGKHRPTNKKYYEARAIFMKKDHPIRLAECRGTPPKSFATLISIWEFVLGRQCSVPALPLRSSS
ncbi:hypothetical protein [Xanthobacter sp.]|uniref:hypothetical protein n=1 Tax=Xanthobacter sp. TaxID=35809 RepID=UPI0025E309DE|nr:hypothetical protein [Xanthobacter sp.]